MNRYPKAIARESFLHAQANLSSKKQLNSFEVRHLIGYELTKKRIKCGIPITKRSLYNFIIYGLPHDVDNRGRTSYNKKNVLKWLSDYKVETKILDIHKKNLLSLF